MFVTEEIVFEYILWFFFFFLVFFSLSVFRFRR